MHASIDISTLNIAAIKQLKTYTLPPTYHLGSYGSGCAGDAPGFPTYMIQPVYSKCGGTPRNAPEAILNIEGVNYVLRRWEPSDTSWEEHYARFRRLCHRIWNPLPMEHERVQLWMMHQYQHFHHCYLDASQPERSSERMVIFPVPDYKLKTAQVLTIPATATDEDIANIRRAQALENEAAEALNSVERRRVEAIAIPENHMAVVGIREFYPEHQPNLEWIANPPRRSQEDWWETAATKPTPETCTPRHSLSGHGAYTWCHPKEPGRHCHFCGHDNPKEEK